jgi:hypothetical protein
MLRVFQYFSKPCVCRLCDNQWKIFSHFQTLVTKTVEAYSHYVLILLLYVHSTNIKQVYPWILEKLSNLLRREFLPAFTIRTLSKLLNKKRPCKINVYIMIWGPAVIVFVLGRAITAHLFSPLDFGVRLYYTTQVRSFYDLTQLFSRCGLWIPRDLQDLAMGVCTIISVFLLFK